MAERDHERHMRRALELAAKVPDLPFGSVIVRQDDGAVVAEGWNRSGQNPTWHGEIEALNALFASGFRGDPATLMLYTTAEPCPMCMAAMLWSGIGTVVFGTSIRFLQAHGWRQIDVLADEIVRRSPAWTCNLVGGVLEAQCNALFAAGPPNAPPPGDVA